MKFLDRNHLKFLIRSWFKRSRPFYSLIFQVTNLCNSRCITCFNWKTLNKDTSRELTFEEIDKFTKKLGLLQTVTFGGGEPFMRQDLPEIVEIFGRNNKLRVAALATNCLNPDRILSMSERILQKFKGVLKIGLSLDGIGNDHDKIRGVPGNFENFLETYKRLAQLKKKYPGLLRLRICATVFVNKEYPGLNVGKMPELLSFVAENLEEIDSIGFELLRGDFNKEQVRELTAEEFEPLLEVFKKNKRIRFFDRGIALSYYQFCFEVLKKKNQVIPCRISAFYPVVDAVGNVYPCESRPEKLGNLRDFDFDLTRVWKSKKARQVRQSVRKKECYCTHAAYQIPNIYLSPKAAQRILKEAEPDAVKEKK